MSNRNEEILGTLKKAQDSPLGWPTAYARDVQHLMKERDDALLQVVGQRKAAQGWSDSAAKLEEEREELRSALHDHQQMQEESDLQIEEFKAWQVRCMGIIAPISERVCIGMVAGARKQSCLDAGLTGSQACLPCKAKHLRENPKLKSVFFAMVGDVLHRPNDSSKPLMVPPRGETLSDLRVEDVIERCNYDVRYVTGQSMTCGRPIPCEYHGPHDS